jgi:hypothetical protein
VVVRDIITRARAAAEAEAEAEEVDNDGENMELHSEFIELEELHDSLVVLDNRYEKTEGALHTL